MVLVYETVYSTTEPKPVEIGKTTVYFRKDITSVDRMSPLDEPYKEYTYQEASMSLEEYEKYSKEHGTSSLTQLVSGQKVGDDNQLTIMEAIADLYEVIANLKQGGTFNG